MKYLPGRPIEKPGSGGGMIFLFISGEGVQTKVVTASIALPGTEAEGRPPQTSDASSCLF